MTAYFYLFGTALNRTGRDECHRKWRLTDCPGRGARLQHGNRLRIACGRLFADFFIVFRYLDVLERSAIDLKQEGAPASERPLRDERGTLHRGRAARRCHWRGPVCDTARSTAARHPEAGESTEASRRSMWLWHPWCARDGRWLGNRCSGMLPLLPMRRPSAEMAAGLPAAALGMHPSWMLLWALLTPPVPTAASCRGRGRNAIRSRGRRTGSPKESVFRELQLFQYSAYSC